MDVVQISRHFVINVIHDGEDGQDAVRLGLDNSNDSFIYDGSGLNHSAPVTAQAMLYDGVTLVTDGVTYTISDASGVTVKVPGTYPQQTYPDAAWIDQTGLLTVNGLSALVTEGYVEVQATYKGQTFYDRMTLKKLINADKYDIVIIPSAIAFNTSTGTPASTVVIINVYKTTIGGTRTKLTDLPAGYTLTAKSSSGGTMVISHESGSDEWTFDTDNVNHISYDIELKDAATNTLDAQTIPVNKSANGESGTSPYVADLDNQMDSVRCHDNGKPVDSQTVSTKLSMYYGSSLVNFTVGVKRNGVDVVLGTAASGVTVSYNTTTRILSVAYTAAATINYPPDNLLKDVFDITLTHAESQTVNVERALRFCVNAVTGDVYNLKPSVSEINVGRTDAGSYSPSTFTLTCGYKRKDINGGVTSVDDVQDVIDSKYYVYFRFHDRTKAKTVWEAYHLYTSDKGLLAPFSVVSYDSVQFVMCTGMSSGNPTGVVDIEDVPVVSDGRNGTSPWIADLDNEMDSVACNLEGKPMSEQTVSTNVSLFYGSTRKNFTVEVFKDAACSSSQKYQNSSTLSGGIAVWWGASSANTNTVNVKVSSALTISGKINVYIKLTSSDDNTKTAVLTFTVNGVRPGANGEPAIIYSLEPDVSEIKKDKTGTAEKYSVTCSVKKIVGNSVEYVTTGVTLQRKKDDDADWSDVTIPDEVLCSDVSSKLQYRLKLGNTVVDQETIYVVTDGKDGENAIRVDLDNEMDSMLYDGAGNKLSANIVSHAHLYDGINDKTSDATWALSAIGCQIQSDTGSTITVTGVTDTDASVTVTATYNGKTYTATMSIKKFVNADKYDLDVSPNALSLNTTEGWSASKTITIKVMRTPSGGGTPSAVNPSTYGLTVSASVGTLSSYNTSTSGFTLTITQSQATSNESTVISLTKSNDGSKVYDRETVPFNKAENGSQGPEGDDGSYYVNEYARSVSRTQYGPGYIDSSTGTSPIDQQQGWTSIAPLPSSTYKYIWRRTALYNPNTDTYGDFAYICETGLDGNSGVPGHAGRFYYYAGEYTTGTYSQYLMEETQAPFVKSGSSFWMLDFKGNEPSSLPAAATDNPGISSSCWTEMSSEQQYYIAKAFFGEYAQFGSFIINGDWMISTVGIRNGATSEDYTYFNPMFGSGDEILLHSNVNVTYQETPLGIFSLKGGSTYTFTITVDNTATRSRFVLYIRNQGGADSALRTITFDQDTTTLTQTFSYTPYSDGKFYFEVDKWSESVTVIANIKVKCAGVFIPNFAIDGLTGRVYQNNAVVRGDVQAITVLSSNDQMETVIEAGCVEIRSKLTQSYGVFRINSNGEVVLSMFDKDGKKVIDLGGTEEQFVNGEWITYRVAVRVKDYTSNPKSYYTVNDTDNDVNTYYYLKLGQMINSNNVIEYFLPPTSPTGQGDQTTDSDVIARNDCAFTQKSTSEAGIKTLIKIPDGYYAKVNNGRFDVEANQYGPTNYKLDLYHFVDGKLTDIYTQRFSL